MTTAPAPTIARRPIDRPGRIIAPPPMDAPSRTTVVVNESGYCLLAGERVVGERGVRADEDIVLQADAVPELNAAFHCDPIADDHVVLDEDSVIEVHVAADLCSGQDVRKGPDAGSISDPGGLADGLRVNEVAHVKSPAVKSFKALHTSSTSSSVNSGKHGSERTRPCFDSVMGKNESDSASKGCR